MGSKQPASTIERPDVDLERPLALQAGRQSRRLTPQNFVLPTAHKLARTVFAVLRDGQPYRDPEVDYEALVVKRNAPRWLAKLAEFGILEPREDGTMTVNWANS